MRILLIDSDPGFENALRHCYADVVRAPSISEAMRDFDAGEFDMAFVGGPAIFVGPFGTQQTDRTRAALSVIDAIRLREGSSDQWIPIVFISEGIDPEAEIACLDAGADFSVQITDGPGVIRARVLAWRRLIAMQREAVSLSMVDHLTGLWNRRFFDETLRREWGSAVRHKRAISLLMCDIDHFKAYNDAMGHPEGDTCLSAVAGAIRASVPRKSDYCCRYGGEEFAIILPETPGDNARRVAERLISAVRDLAIPHPQSDTGHITISIGLASLNGQDTCRNEFTLLTMADNALYGAKRDGRDRVATDAALFAVAVPIAA